MDHRCLSVADEALLNSRATARARRLPLAAKRDNFVAAVFNFNENVSPTRPCTKSSVRCCAPLSACGEGGQKTIQRRIYRELKIINYAKR
jgi:hypothetical protein